MCQIIWCSWCHAMFSILVLVDIMIVTASIIMKGWLWVASERRKILLVSSEAAPYAKSGGLGDVVGSLPKALKEADVDVRVVLPKYATIKEEHMQDVEYLGSFLINLAWRTQEAKILKKNTSIL